MSVEAVADRMRARLYELPLSRGLDPFERDWEQEAVELIAVLEQLVSRPHNQQQIYSQTAQWLCERYQEEGKSLGVNLSPFHWLGEAGALVEAAGYTQPAAADTQVGEDLGAEGYDAGYHQMRDHAMSDLVERMSLAFEGDANYSLQMAQALRGAAAALIEAAASYEEDADVPEEAADVSV